jgi:sec-independent protein translocase protein TatB
MFDVAPSEFLLVAVIALVVIGPKDLPRVMRTVGRWVGKARGVARQFRAGFDEMLRESELREMEEKWRAENERIMREHPAITPPMTPTPIESSSPSGADAPAATPQVDPAAEPGQAPARPVDDAQGKLL